MSIFLISKLNYELPTNAVIHSRALANEWIVVLVRSRVIIFWCLKYFSYTVYYIDFTFLACVNETGTYYFIHLWTINDIYFFIVTETASVA
jgi:hypothetical protein